MPPPGAERTGGNAEADARPQPGRVERLRERWQRTMMVLRAPRVRIEMYGDDEVRAIHRAFTARHRRFKFTSAKRWGVALMNLPESNEQFRAATSQHTRRKCTRASKAGFRYTVVAPIEHIDEILEINRSAPLRQGRPMDAVYTERDQVLAEIGSRPTLHGIVDGDGRLRAYADVPDVGDALVFSYVIGHADHLAAGIMYLLVCEVIRHGIERRHADGSPKWVMYDTFWGGSSGLAWFKERIGFRPYTVDWVWAERAAGTKSGAPDRTQDGPNDGPDPVPTGLAEARA